MNVHTSAPLRIDWAGGWTDVPVFAERCGGAVVNSAISLLVHVDFLHGDERIRLHAEDLDQHVSIESAGSMVYDGKLDLHKAALNTLPVTGGIEILSRSDAPSGSGLGASGALDVALVAGLARLREEVFSPEELAELAFHVEANELKLLGGRQDQYAAALGGFHSFSFGRDSVEIRRLAVAADAADDLCRHIVLAYTGRSHFSSATHSRVWERFGAGDREIGDALESLKDLAAECAGALEAADWTRLAGVIDENWRHQQRLDKTISTPHTLTMEEAAREAGAWGLKATGAGAGGCVVALGPPDAQRAIGDALERLGATVLDVAFSMEGVQLAATDPDAPDAG